MVLASVIMVLALAISSSGISIAQSGEDRPNIIFILTDDQRWDALGHAGNAIILTPNMDRLARQGVYFPNAFVTTPICAASRASIVTGMYERTHQFTFGTPPLARRFVENSYFYLLKKQGYHTGFIGKFGMSFENRMDTALFDYYDPYMAGFYFRLVGEAWSEHKYLTYLTGEKAVDFIRSAPRDSPFCLSVSFNAPHAEDQSPDQYIYPEDLISLYQDVTIPPPALGGNDYFMEQPVYVREGLNRIRWYWRFDTEPKYQKMVKSYYRMITAVDKVLGDIRQVLAETGNEQNTIIIFSSDNGYFLGERGLAGKWLMYENSLRIPLIIYDPRDGGGGRSIEQMVLNIDIAPTMLEMAGIEPAEPMQGQSLLSLMKDKHLEFRDYFLCEHLYELKYIPKSEGIRTPEWKYFRYMDDPSHEELYYLPADSQETNNLAHEEKYRSKMDYFRKACDEKVAELISSR